MLSVLLLHAQTRRAIVDMFLQIYFRFGLVVFQEAYIHELDNKTGASLKLTVLNPLGRIWTMVAGGGASVIYR